MAIVDDETLDYEVRLDRLQHRLAAIAEGAGGDAERRDVEAAILALEARAKLKTDTPEGAPETHNYGGVERSDLRRYSVKRWARDMWRRIRG